MMYQYGNQEIDAVELKTLLVSRGVHVADEVYARFKDKVRLSKNPLECNTLRLPDGTIVQLSDLSFHMEYIKSVINWNTLSQLKYLPQLRTDFSLRLDHTGRPILYYKKQPVTPVQFVDRSDFYQQQTASGLPYLGNAVLQGTEWLSFPLLWKCDYAWRGEPCQYCFSGGELAALSKRHKPVPKYPTPDDVAEIVEYAILKEKCATSIQITGGSSFNSRAEMDTIRNILQAIDRRVGRKNIPGEILLYVTPPKHPESIDALFEAGADRVACSLEIWNESLAQKIMPGKMKYTGRQRHLECLHYIAARYGKNRACSNFIIGLEPLESVLAGAEYLAANGIVPIASVWIPFGRPVLGSMKTPELDYYRQFKTALSRIYRQYGIVPPGGCGLNVCVCRDIYLNLECSSPTYAVGPEVDGMGGFIAPP
jgi:hypothetical protein